MANYLIIDLPATRKHNAVMFWGVGTLVVTANPAAAMLVNEDHVNRNLERFDNGSTTQAVIAEVAHELGDRIDSVLNFPLNKPLKNEERVA